MKKFTKCLSLFLILCIITTSSAFSVSSLTENATEQNVPEVSGSTPKTETRKDEATSPDVLPILTLSSLSKEECMISKYVNEAEFNKSKHVKRLPAEETLDTYVFLNNDGTKSVYYMYENVKFIDDDGKTKEKDVSLVRKDNGYGIVRNNVDLYIPDAPRSGIDVSYDEYDVKITPVSSVLLSSSGRKENETVVYDGFFGAKTQLKYTPMLSGIKEDVVLEEYIPNASFDFILDTDGLFVYTNDEGIYLAPSASSKKVFDLGKVIVYDAVGRPTTGTMKIKTVTAGQRYQITVSAPEEFLTDPLTSYPVTIDPSVTVSDSVSGSGAIEDAVLFAGLPNHNGGNYIYLSLGYIDTTYTVGRVAVRLPGLYNSSLYNNLTDMDITSVKFYCWDTSGNQTHLINIHPITGPSWTESTATWSQSHTRDWSLDCGAYMPNAQWTAFDITALVKRWKNNVNSAQLGFMMSNSEEPTGFLKKAPYSSEVGGSTYKPYVVMTYNNYSGSDMLPYGTYIIENAKTGKNIDIESQNMSNGTIIHQWQYHGEPTQQWVISYHSGGAYPNESYCTIRSARNLSYYLGVQNDASGDAAVVLRNGTITDGMKWEITKISDNKYKISSKSGKENNKSLSLSSISSTANGNDVVQRTYANDSNYSDEWILHCISSMPTVNWDILYDEAYQTRYSDAQDRIIYHARAVRQVYMNLFGIWVNYYTPTQFTSYADANCSSTPTDPCGHSADMYCFNSIYYTDGRIELENLHHKNIYNIFLRIPIPNITQEIRTSFVGHDCCVAKHDSSSGTLLSHGSAGVNGLSYSGSGISIIINFNSNESERKTLLHEFGHIYGGPDHYGGSTPSTDQRNDEAGETIFSKYCIYGEERESASVLTNLTICEGCQRAIRANKNLFNHE